MNFDRYEGLARLLTLGALLVALAAAVAAPLLALAWSSRPFPGFLVGATLVVDNTNGAGWSGRAAGLAFPYHVTRIGGRAVAGPADFDAVLAGRVAGDAVSVLADLPNGTTRLFPAVGLIPFPHDDLVRLFWVPYLVGLVYLAMGGFIYRVRGRTRSGLWLAVFCINGAIVCLLFFDLNTTHVAPLVWTLALAQLGAAAINLALRFPQERTPALSPWLLSAPHTVSTAVGAWGALALLNYATAPWAYLAAWRATFLFVALGLIAFLALVFNDARTGRAPLVRRQARIMLFGSVIGFVPVSLRFLSPLVGVPFPMEDWALLPGLLIFPFAVSIAILRYRLLDADVLATRTLVYGVLTAVLAGVFTAGIGVSQKLFVVMTGNQSDAAIVITTLVVAAVFAPLRARLDAFVNAELRHASDRTAPLREFGERVRAHYRLADAALLAGQLLDEAAGGLRARSGAVSLLDGDRPVVVHTHGPWTGEAWLSVPLEADGRRYGTLQLGPTADGRAYQPDDFETLRRVAAEVTHALRLARAPAALEPGEARGPHEGGSVVGNP